MAGSVAQRLNLPAIEQGELRRRLVHASGSGVPLLYVLGEPYGVTWGMIQAFAVLVAVITLVLEVLRLFVGLDWRIYDELTREYEQENVAGYALYAIGMAVVALVFEPAIAVAAMLMLAIGDPISGILGSGGVDGMKESSVLATMFLVCFALALPFVAAIPAALGALAATIGDGAKPVVAGHVIDDNLTIPIGGAVAMFVGIEYLLALM